MFRSPVNPSIRLGTSTDPETHTVPDIDCQYDASDALFKNVKEDQIIQIKGVLKFTDLGMEMKPCKFVPF
jgi:hypothetical protein